MKAAVHGSACQGGAALSACGGHPNEDAIEEPIQTKEEVEIVIVQVRRDEREPSNLLASETQRPD